MPAQRAFTGSSVVPPEGADPSERRGSPQWTGETLGHAEERHEK